MQNKSNIKQKKLSQVYLHGFTRVNIRGIGINYHPNPAQKGEPWGLDSHSHCP